MYSRIIAAISLKNKLNRGKTITVLGTDSLQALPAAGFLLLQKRPLCSHYKPKLNLSAYGGGNEICAFSINTNALSAGLN